MRTDTIKEAIEEAQRFLKASRKCLQWATENGWSNLDGDRYTAAVRRASMDLTRKLADLRARR